MKIDFYQEALKQKDSLIKNTQKLLKINSELEEFNPDSPAPFGKGINDALEMMLALGESDGFKTLNVSGYAGHIELGNAFEYIGVMGHLDVVPAGSNWDSPPYEAKIIDNKIIARGATDDKGPTMAAYYALKILKELKLPLQKRIKLILGTDEETKWRGINYYFKQFPEQPLYGFIPDASFPLTYAEKGILRMKISGAYEAGPLLSFKAGLRDNMVPDSCQVILNSKIYETAFLEYLKKHNYQGKTNIKDDYLHLSIEGKSAHGATPQLGLNAAYIMIEFFKEIDLNNGFIDLIDTYLLNDSYGKKMGVDFKDQETGSLTINAGLFNYDEKGFEIIINPRYPNNVDSEELIKKMIALFEVLGHEAELISHQKSLYVDPNSFLVKTLLNVYKKHSKDFDALPLTTGGGTYARAMENSVAFGPEFPGTNNLIHQPNEFIDIDELVKMVAIYAESLYELAK
ncbi:MAG: dipeptidase PepV [Acholeplasmatales bacterium]|jgi:succinyl-diaminopimelate desuccinylase|nr:dipeptidase PepV [Acholeplasmataceae bacterium]MDY0115289.1 dipeptidase PepV [Acholeplasmatales bacterium]MCK9233850.1 dipeptidase PepV [Acholeplasmataceae bacterium]MCK9289224.1 dipeptidase PepV [Acholeplasmataceae bacterium]MCK9427670.1 dipeptidase PepV [Acholeplasmataceae bacterium]